MFMRSTALQSEVFSAKNVLRSAIMTLQGARIETASLDARLLLQHVLQVSREKLLETEDMFLDSGQYFEYQELVQQRAQRKPIAQLIGKRDFWDLAFKVTEATLDPRPDSEALIEAVIHRMRKQDEALRILDLGTGTGCLLLTLLNVYKNATGVGVDKCEQALQVAQENAKLLNMTDRATLVHSDWADKITGEFDIVISNPPYIPTSSIAFLSAEVRCFEPKSALDGGEDGLDCYRAIIPQLPKLLKPEGLAVLEIGMGQQEGVEFLITENGLEMTGAKEDLAGVPRCILASRKA